MFSINRASLAHLPSTPARLLFLLLLVISASAGCGAIKKKPAGKPDEMAFVAKPLPPEKAKEVLGELGKNFAYGPALGETAINVGTSVVFPPYALYLLGNAVLSLSGYEPVTVSGMLPERAGEAWSSAYDEVAGAPGRVVAAVAGKEFRSRDVAEKRLREILLDEPVPNSQVKAFSNGSK